MDRKLAAELERLLSELADEGATRQRVERIESLLLDKPELQDRYWSWMDNHIILGTDRAAILGDSRASDPLVSVGHTDALRSFVPRATTHTRRHIHWLAPLLAISACLLWMILPGDFSWRDAARQLFPFMADIDGRDVWHIPKITRVSWEGPYFAKHELDIDARSGADVGLVSLGFVDGLPANGYVLRLEPGTSAELMMAADAYAENNLSVTELSASGTPVRRSVSFNNFGANGLTAFGNEPNRARRYGLIGTWSEFNDTNKPKYYLINGIHKSLNPDLSPPHPEQEFQLSRMVVALDEPDLILLGWDDSGIEPSEKSDGVEPDGDYDDISVAIRLAGKGIQPKPPNKNFPNRNFRLTAAPHSMALVPQVADSDRFRFTLEPGEIAVLKIASEARKTNAIYVVREGSDEVIWSAESTPPGTMNLGAVAIQNTSEQDQAFAIFGENSAGNRDTASEWQGSRIATIHTQPGCSILGFEDDAELNEDFDDIRITLLSMSPNRSTPFAGK